MAMSEAAKASNSKISDACIMAHGLRALVCSPSHKSVRRFIRRLAALLALKFDKIEARWQDRARSVAVSPRQIQSVRAFLADCRAGAKADDPGMVKARRHGALPLRRAVQFIQVIERANSTLLGADECAARVRRYVGEHETPQDDRHAFATLCKVIFAQGLGFEVVAKHWPALEAAFSGFDPKAVASLCDDDVGKLLAEPIIRNRLKVVASVENARNWLARTDGGTYLSRVAELAVSDNASAGWPSLVRVLQEDFHRLREPAARLTLKRWGFFNARVHPGTQRVLMRLGVLRQDADGFAALRTISSIAEKVGRDPYAIEAELALFAGLGPCKDLPKCDDCLLNEECPSAGSVPLDSSR
jgi:3-methyladenine DNA glycosylase Tag